jgi:streptogramin lyase
VATDGSVWFGEQALPGMGHLFSNGTLIEYAWPFHYDSPEGLTFIWGIAVWDGCVWASDQAGSQLVAVDPETGMIRTISLAPESFPYTLTVAPDGSLWFTEALASKLGRVDTQFNLKEYSTVPAGTPAQIAFANESLGYYVDAGNVGLVQGAVYSFNPRDFVPTQLNSDGQTLLSPTSLALTNEGLWVAQHASANLAYYSFSDQNWSLYPTTPVDYARSTLPYFVATNGSTIWFNEHYANRLAKIDTSRGLLTEYSLSDPPANNITGIDNALTLALSKDKAWFTELTADYIGYVDASYHPTFNFKSSPNTSLRSNYGTNTSATLDLEGNSSKLTIVSSDSETATARPQKIILGLSKNEIPNLNGDTRITLTVSASAELSPGEYTILVAVSDGLVNQGIYVKLFISM